MMYYPMPQQQRYSSKVNQQQQQQQWESRKETDQSVEMQRLADKYLGQRNNFLSKIEQPYDNRTRSPVEMSMSTQQYLERYGLNEDSDFWDDRRRRFKLINYSHALLQDAFPILTKSLSIYVQKLPILNMLLNRETLSTAARPFNVRIIKYKFCW